MNEIFFWGDFARVHPDARYKSFDSLISAETGILTELLITRSDYIVLIICESVSGWRVIALIVVEVYSYT